MTLSVQELSELPSCSETLSLLWPFKKCSVTDFEFNGLNYYTESDPKIKITLEFNIPIIHKHNVIHISLQKYKTTN